VHAQAGVRARPLSAHNMDALMEAEDEAHAQHVEVGFDQAGAFKSALIGADLAGRRRTFR
jgi:hypothetical protein